MVRNTSILSIRPILRSVTATTSKGPRHTTHALDHCFDAGARASLNGRSDHLRGWQFKLEHYRMFVLTFQLSAANFVDVDLARPQACKRDGPSSPRWFRLFPWLTAAVSASRTNTLYVCPPTASLSWRAGENEQAVPEWTTGKRHQTQTLTKPTFT